MTWTPRDGASPAPLRAKGRDAERPWAPPPWRVWAGFFGYALATALVVQLIVLPRAFPGWNPRTQQVSPDAWTYHWIAVVGAERIRREGWSASEVHPLGGVTTTVASAVYALTMPEPWTVTPVNAALHATAGLVLVGLLERLLGDRRRAIWATLPLVCFPSAVTWYALLNKDELTIAGQVLFVFGCAALAAWSAAGPPSRRVWPAAAAVVGGALLIGLARAYMLDLLVGVMVLIAASALVAVTTGRLRRRVPGRRVVVVCVVAWALAAALGGLRAWLPGVLGVAVDLPDDPHLQKVEGKMRGAHAGWERSAWLPSGLDRRLRILAVRRDAFFVQYPGAASQIDEGVHFHRAADVVAYVPRAAVVAVLAPFPATWLDRGGSAAGTLLRRVTAVEMAVVYASLAGLPLAVWRWRRRAETWVVVAVCLGFLILYGLVVPNVGALYRIRYAFLMILVGLGLAGGLASRRGHEGGRLA